MAGDATGSPWSTRLIDLAVITARPDLCQKQTYKSHRSAVPVYHLGSPDEKEERIVGKEPQTAKQQSRLAQITRQDRFQIALALHSPVEINAQAANYQERTEEELLQGADALLPAIQARTIFLEGELLSKPGFEEAICESNTRLLIVA